MDTNKNSYTIMYATILVVFVAAVLAFVSLSLKDKQQENISLEKQQNLLACVALGQDADNAPDKAAYVKAEFAKAIKEAVVVDGNGKVIDRTDKNISESEAFKLSTAGQYAILKESEVLSDQARNDLRLPVFICNLPDGSQAYIFSAYGAGLWGPIWGWVALKTDFSTIAGVKFDHKGETPGLGAEIATEKFSAQFNDKEIFSNGELVSIKVVKGGADPDALNEVDAISGGTITSNALGRTIKTWFKAYLPYIESLQQLAATPMPIEAEDAVAETSNENK